LASVPVKVLSLVFANSSRAVCYYASDVKSEL
jgi:hypothetical protein